MLIFSIILFFSIWLIIWYWYFYVTFWQKDLIKNLKSENKKLNDTNVQIELDLNEYKAQNDVLINSIKKVRLENQNFREVVSELSRYQHAIQQWSEQAVKLSQILSIYDPKIKSMIDDVIHSYDEDDENDDELNVSTNQENVSSKKWM